MQPSNRDKKFNTTQTCRYSDEQGSPGKRKEVRSMFRISWNLLSTSPWTLSRSSENIPDRGIIIVNNSTKAPCNGALTSGTCDH